MKKLFQKLVNLALVLILIHLNRTNAACTGEITTTTTIATTPTPTTSTSTTSTTTTSTTTTSTTTTSTTTTSTTTTTTTTTRTTTSTTTTTTTSTTTTTTTTRTTTTTSTTTTTTTTRTTTTTTTTTTTISVAANAYVGQSCSNPGGPCSYPGYTCKQFYTYANGGMYNNWCVLTNSALYQTNVGNYCTGTCGTNLICYLNTCFYNGGNMACDLRISNIGNNQAYCYAGDCVNNRCTN